MIDSDAKKPFSMFWIEKGQHKSAEAAQALASLMQQASKSKKSVNWLVHDKGALTFMAAAEIVAHQKLEGVQNKQAAEKKAVTGQNVYFSNPSPGGKKALEKACNEAGLNYLNTNANNRDLFNFDTLKNLGLELGKPLVVGASISGAGLAATNVDTLQTAVNGAFDAVSSGNILAVGLSLAAMGYAISDVRGKLRTMTVGASCTFGKGNQKWYTDDKSFFKKA